MTQRDWSKNLWLVYEPPDVKSLEKFKQAIEVLSAFSQFVIVDWNKSLLVSCTDDEELRQYFAGALNDGAPE